MGAIGSPEGSLPDNPDSEQLATWSAAGQHRTIAEAGLSYATYLRLKISGVVDRYAQTDLRRLQLPGRTRTTPSSCAL